jgi:predicted alpha/beta hydrolase family esterase
MSTAISSHNDPVSKYLITISVASRWGRTDLHTFGKLVEAEHLGWFPETHASRKQLKQRQTPDSPI